MVKSAKTSFYPSSLPLPRNIASLTGRQLKTHLQKISIKYLRDAAEVDAFTPESYLAFASITMHKFPSNFGQLQRKVSSFLLVEFKTSISSFHRY